MPQGRNDIPPIIRRKLTGLRRALSVWLWIDGLAQLAVWVVVIVLLDLGIDRLFRMDRAQRGVMWVVMLVAVAVIIWRRLARPLSRQLADDALAARVEAKHHAELREQMISSLQFARMENPAGSGASEELVKATIERGGSAAEQVVFNDVIDRRRRNRNLTRGVVAVCFLAALFVLFTPTMGMWWERNVLVGTSQWPQNTRLSVIGAEEGVFTVPKGDDVDILVRAAGVVPDEVVLDHKPAKRGKRITEQMVKVGRDTFRLTLHNVLEEMDLRARGGDGQTEWISMKLVARPTVTDLQLEVTPPAYTGEQTQVMIVMKAIDPKGDAANGNNAAPGGDGQPIVKMGQGSYYVPAGSTVVIRGIANKDLGAAKLLHGSEVIAQLDRPAANLRAFSATLSGEALRSGTYGIALADTTEPAPLESRHPVRFSIRVADDQTPTVRAQLVGIGDLIVPGAVVPISCRFSDDYAITDASVTWQRQQLDMENAPSGALHLDGLADEFGSKRIGPYEYRMEAEPLGATVGEHLTFKVIATDNDTVTGPKVGESTLFSLKVVTEEELRTELLRREQEQRMEFEQLLSDQEELLVAARAVQAGLRTEGKLTAELHRELTGAERRQRLAAGRCQAIADQFEQILAEVSNNRLEDAGGPMHRRLRSRIIAPLAKLAATDIPYAADGLDVVSKASADPAQRDAALDQTIERQREIVATMQDILRSMVKLEGYQEAINLVREIVKQQKDVRAETIKALEKRISDIFED